MIRHFVTSSLSAAETATPNRNKLWLAEYESGSMPPTPDQEFWQNSQTKKDYDQIGTGRCVMANGCNGTAGARAH